MAEIELPEIELPSPFSNLANADKPAIYLNILAVVGALAGASVCVGFYRRRKRIQKLRKICEKRITNWLAEKERERDEKTAFLRKSGELRGTEVHPLQINLNETFDLWKEANRLGCDNAFLLKDLVIAELNKEIPLCIDNFATDWRCSKRLQQIITQIETLKAQKDVGSNWNLAKKMAYDTRNKNRIQLLKVMVTSSKFRMMGLALTSVVAFVSDKLECAVGDTYSQWMECFVQYAPHRTILKWAVLNLTLCLSTAAITYGTEKVSAILLSGFKRETDERLYEALGSMDTEFYDTYTDKEVNEIADLTGELLQADTKLQKTVRQIIRIFSKVSHLWSVNKRLTVALGGICGLYAIIDYIVEHSTDLSGEDVVLDDEASGADGPLVPKMRLDFYSVMQNIKVLRTFSCERAIIRALLANAQESDTDGPTHKSLVTAMVDASGNWGLSGIRLWGVWHAAWLVQQKVFDHPTAQLNNLVTQAFSIFQEAQNVSLAWIDEFGADAGLLHNVFSYVPKIEKDEGIIPTDYKGHIEFRNVTFAYPTAPDRFILKGLSFEAKPGQMIGLVGPSGGGKSTTMQLLQRLYDPVKGAVLLDGIDLRQYNPRWLRAQTAVVSQNVVLFDMSIEDNIRLANPNATREEVMDAARKANCYDFIMRLPSGFSTNLSGCQLSGGQRQRIAIARALAMKAKIMLLDEATSALDNASEREVQTALNEAIKDKLCFTITHRLVTVKNADKIVVIAKGICAEEGTFDELVEKGGIFADLAHEVKGDAKHTIPVYDLPAGSKNTDLVKDDEVRLQQRSNTVDLSVVQGFTRDVQTWSRKLQDLNIHTNHLDYPKDVRHNVEKVLAGLQDTINRMGKHTKEQVPSTLRYQGPSIRTIGMIKHRMSSFRKRASISQSGSKILETPSATTN